VDDALAALFEKIGQVDHIVYTAGDLISAQPLESITVEKLQQFGMVRVFSAILVAKHASKYLVNSNKSSFTLTSGVAAEKPMGKGWGVGSFYGGGLYSLVKGLAKELAPIRTNLVSPGAVDTELLRELEDKVGAGAFQAMASMLPVGQIGEPQDIAEAYLYLMKDKGVTGAVIASNGGWTLV
jgi:NAD(P)-dependent dehydrogenase (short-subunit alcohol dehydrogenase family)